MSERGIDKARLTPRIRILYFSLSLSSRWLGGQVVLRKLGRERGENMLTFGVPACFLAERRLLTQLTSNVANEASLSSRLKNKLKRRRRRYFGREETFRLFLI